VKRNWVTQKDRIHSKSVSRDPYRTLALNAEKRNLLQQLTDLHSKPSQRTTVEATTSKPISDAAKAIAYGADQYEKLLKPRHAYQVKKNRTIANKAVELHFPHLSGRQKTDKIDSLRARIVTEVKRRLASRKKK